ncbi:hypothetical protein D3C72_1515040 [compost metagenome]
MAAKISALEAVSSLIRTMSFVSGLQASPVALYSLILPSRDFAFVIISFFPKKTSATSKALSKRPPGLERKSMTSFLSFLSLNNASSVFKSAKASFVKPEIIKNPVDASILAALKKGIFITARVILISKILSSLKTLSFTTSPALPRMSRTIEARSL